MGVLEEEKKKKNHGHPLLFSKKGFKKWGQRFSQQPNKPFLRSEASTFQRPSTCEASMLQVFRHLMLLVMMPPSISKTSLSETNEINLKLQSIVYPKPFPHFKTLNGILTFDNMKNA